MNKAKVVDRITDDLVTITAILAIAYLGINGVANTEVLMAIAGLGGYRLHKRRQETK